MAEVQRGRRLLPSYVDQVAAHTPNRSFMEIASRIDCSDYRTVTYSQYANAVNRAAWWMKELMGLGDGYPRVAYAGPSDLRYFILLMAGVKTDNHVRSVNTRFEDSTDNTNSSTYLRHETLCRLILQFSTRTIAQQSCYRAMMRHARPWHRH